MNHKNVLNNKNKTMDPRILRNENPLSSVRAFTNTDYQAWTTKLAQDENFKQINDNFGKLENSRNPNPIRRRIPYVCQIKGLGKKSQSHSD
jgi:hypothetical protein